MRVLMFSWEFPPHIVGGLGRHVADIAPALAAQEIELHLVTPLIGAAPALERLAPGLTVHRVNLPAVPDAPTPVVAHMQQANHSLEAKGMALHQQLGGFDLIHAHDWLVAYSSVALKYALRRPLVATIHSLERGRMQGHLGSDQSRAIHGTEWWLAHEAQRTITVSQFMAYHLQDALGLAPETIDVIYNGVKSASPVQARLRTQVRRRYAAPDEQLICYVGRLVYEKGVQTLIAALPQVHQRLPQVKVVIAGTGPMADELRDQAVALGMADKIVFTGYISDDERNALLATADASVFPSLYEPFGIVALEAMSFSCPVIVAATGGLAEIVRAHETGIVTEPGNAASLAWGILHTLERPDWAAARAANALHDLHTTYSWQRVAAQTIGVYQHTSKDWQLAGRGRPSLPTDGLAIVHAAAQTRIEYARS